MTMRLAMMVVLAMAMTACGHETNKDYAAMNKIPMHTVRVGCMLVDLPEDGRMGGQPEGYLRYRRFYTGYDQARTYAVAVPEWQQQVRTMMQTRGVGIADALGTQH